jgi:drug/metabolite transporter (DMT)-like permease
VAATVGFIGIIALNISSDGFSFYTGDLLILFASFCSLFSNVISKKIFAKVSPITSTGISQLFGGLVLFAIGGAMGGGVRFQFNASIWIMAYICIVSTVSYCLWFGIVKNGELSKLFIIKFAEPLFACVFGAILRKENIFQWQYLIAFVLISAGIILGNKTKKERKNENKNI